MSRTKDCRGQTEQLDAAFPATVGAAVVPEDAAVAGRAVGLGAHGGFARSALRGTADVASGFKGRGQFKALGSLNPFDCSGKGG